MTKWTRFWLRHPFRYCYRHRELKPEHFSYACYPRWCDSCKREKDEQAGRGDVAEQAAFEEARKS